MVAAAMVERVSVASPSRFGGIFVEEMVVVCFTSAAKNVEFVLTIDKDYHRRLHVI